MRPGWREIATAKEAERSKPRDEEADRLTVREMKARYEQATPVPDEAAPVAGDPDYMIIRRQVPVRKGKWRMVSKEVEEAADE